MDGGLSPQRDAEPVPVKRPRVEELQDDVSDTASGDVKGPGRRRRDVVMPMKAEWVGGAQPQQWQNLFPDLEAYSGVYRPEYSEFSFEGIQTETSNQFSCAQLSKEQLALEGVGNLAANTLNELQQYRKGAFQLAGTLASGQLYPPWVYDFAASHQTQFFQNYRYLEVALLGCVPYLPLPLDFQPYLAPYSQRMKDLDEEFLGFNRYPETLLIPPGYMDLLSQVPNLVLWQLLVNHLAGCHLLAHPFKYVFQVLSQDHHYSVLFCTPEGAYLYHDAAYCPVRGAVLLPNLWFHQDTWTTNCLVPCPLTLHTVFTLIDLIILGYLQEEPDGRIRKYDGKIPTIRPAYEHLATCKQLVIRLQGLYGSVMHEPERRVPLCPVRLKESYGLIDDGSSLVGALYRCLVRGLCYGTDCPLSTPLFRLTPVLDNHRSPYIVTVLVNSVPKHIKLSQVAANLMSDGAFAVPQHAIFVFRWETKATNRTVAKADWDAIRTKLKIPDLENKQQYLNLYAPANITVIVIYSEEAGKQAFDKARHLKKWLRTEFTLENEAVDLWSLDDGGSPLNLFTAYNARDVAGKYTCGWEVQPHYCHLFADFVGELCRDKLDPRVLAVVERVVKEGVHMHHLQGEDLLIYAESICGSAVSPAVIQAITRYDHFTALRPAQNPGIPTEIVPCKSEHFAVMTDSQMVIWAFVTRIVGAQQPSHLVICSSGQTHTKELTHFLAKHLNVYWKPAKNSSLPSNTQLVVVEDWVPQQNDLVWLRDAAASVLLLATQEVGQVLAKLSKGQDLWETMKTRVQVVELTGKQIVWGEAVRVDEVPEVLRYRLIK